MVARGVLLALATVSVWTNVAFFCGAASVPIQERFASNDDDLTAGDDSYLKWFREHGEAAYANNVFATSTGSPSGKQGIAFHWRVDPQEGNLYLAMATKIVDEAPKSKGEPRGGWVAFGIAETGGMSGADVVMYEAASDKLTDAHVLDQYVKPTTDAHQDWILNKVTKTTATHNVTSNAVATMLIVEMQRKLDTNDTQDRPIVDDQSTWTPAHRIIGAWGPESEVSFHGPSRQVRGFLRFHGTTASGNSRSGPPGQDQRFYQSMSEKAEGNVTILPKRPFQIPLQETTYQNYCFSVADLVAAGYPEDGIERHLVGVEAIVDPVSMPHVHHLQIFAGSKDLEDCEKPLIDMDYISGWAPGAVPFEAPEDAGYPMGSPTGVDSRDGGKSFRAFVMQIHFDNANLIPGVLDSTGMRIFFTSKRKPYNVGNLILGDGFVLLKGQSIIPGAAAANTTSAPDEKLGKHRFSCPSDCTAEFFQDEEVTVFLERFHMHGKGLRAANRHFSSNGELLREVAVDFWDYDQAGILYLPQAPYKLRRGDYLETTCYYSPENNFQNDQFGRGAREEMCVGGIAYYPRQPIPFQVCSPNWINPSCRAEYHATTLLFDGNNDTALASALGRTFGVPTMEGTVHRPNDKQQNDSPESKKEEVKDRSSGNRGGPTSLIILVVVWAIGLGH